MLNKLIFRCYHCTAATPFLPLRKNFYNTGHIYIASHHYVFCDAEQDQLFDQSCYHTTHI